MPKLESALENETHKIPLDFEIQTDHLIPVKRPDQTRKKILNTWVKLTPTVVSELGKDP